MKRVYREKSRPPHITRRAQPARILYILVPRRRHGYIICERVLTLEYNARRIVARRGCERAREIGINFGGVGAGHKVLSLLFAKETIRSDENEFRAITKVFFFFSLMRTRSYNSLSSILFFIIITIELFFSTIKRKIRILDFF